MFSSIHLQALAHILWKAKRWRDALLVGRSPERGRHTTGRRNEENGENTEPSNRVTQPPSAETSCGRKEEADQVLRFVNKVSPAPESDPESIEEAENRL